MAYKPKILDTVDGGTGASNTATSGKALIGNGTAFVTSTASFPATAGATGTILRSDGTNWVATTSTYPDTNAISTLVYASASNVLGALATGNNGLLVTSSTGVPSILAGPGATGRVLQSNAAAAPSFSTATFPSTATGTGTILRADGTNWIASTPTYPNAASTAGKAVVSDGTNLVMSTPTFPNASATTRKIIVSDGTNWVASTETWAVPGTSGNILTSNGTNWTSAAPAAGSSSATLTLETFAGNPADSTTYFLGNAIAVTSRTTSGGSAQFLSVPKTGTVTACSVAISVAGTLGSNENCTLTLRLNNTTDVVISSTLQLTAAAVTAANTALSQAVTAGDYIEFKFTGGAWATNPTTVAISVSVLIT